MIEHIIGFDFGDAESVITKTRAIDLDGPKVLRSSYSDSRDIVLSVIGYGKNNKVYIGNMALEEKENILPNRLDVSFKMVPEYGDKEYERLVRDFFNTLYEDLVEEQKAFSPNKTLIVVGHPTAWSSMNDGEPVKILKKIINSSSFGACNIQMIPESRAAAIEVLENLGEDQSLQNIFRSGWSLVIDMGSSTTDFTAVNVQEKNSQPIDHGVELGARLIDREIRDNVVGEHKLSREIIARFRNDRREEAVTDIACRQAKESYFANGKSNKSHAITLDSGEEVLFSIKINKEMMDSILYDKKLIPLNGQQLSWSEVFNKQLCDVSNKLANQGINSISSIVLTGGASRMGFVKDCCKKAFPNLHEEVIFHDKDPQYSISRGLSRIGRLEIRTEEFKKDAQRFIDVDVKRTLNGSYSKFLEKLSDKLTNVCLEITMDEFEKWKRGSTKTISDLEKNVENNINRWVSNELPREIPIISQSWLEETLTLVMRKIEHLESDHNLIKGTLSGVLTINSFDTSKVSIGGRSSRSNTIRGASTDLANIFSGIIGVITGVVGYAMSGVVVVVLNLVLAVIAKISLVIAGWLAAGLTAIGPVGWAILLGLGATAFMSSGGIKEKISAKIRVWDLPDIARDMVSLEKIEKSIKEQRHEIKSGVLAALKEENKMKEAVVGELYKQIKMLLEESVERAKILIKT